MTVDGISAFIHSNAPHSKTALYLSSVALSALAVLFVYLRCAVTRSLDHLPEGWAVKTAAFAAPIPIYVLLIIAPFDADLVPSIMDDQIVVAIAGLYGIAEVVKDIRNTASSANRKKTSVRSI